ncbi:MAG: hemerythrin domain-containing protein [Alistipes sp.]|nr:hemerythrin domain-containing protein [Alistipes sp.]
MNKIIHLGRLLPLSPEMKLFELVDGYPQLLSIFSRLEISFPFGDISIEELCQREGRDAELFIMLCNMHLAPDYRPAEDSLRHEMLKDVVAYLRASHRYYTGYMLPHVANHLERVLEHCDSVSQRALRSFYDDYVRFLAAHFEEEERNIFATIDSIEEQADASFAMLEAPHGDIDDRTNDIASLVIKSLPERVPTPLRCSMLDHIYMLRDDLRRHSDLEMLLLRPLVAKYKKSLKR